MKKFSFYLVIFFSTILITFPLHAQIQVKSNGSMDLNDNELFLRDNSGNTYGIGYGAFGSSEMTIFSDNLIDFRESDQNTLCAQFLLNNKQVNFFGGLGFVKDSWTGGLNVSLVNFVGYDMAAIYPNNNWYGGLGTDSKHFGYAYIDHVYYNYLTDLSDKGVKENIRNIQNVSNKIYQLNPVIYDLKESYFDSISGSAKQRMIAKGKNKAGLIAQDVKEIFPELVHLDENNGLLGVNYVGLIPYLISTVKEQEDRIAVLEEKLNINNQKLKSSSFQNDEINSTAMLYQNTPNPFTENTKIKYNLPDEITTAVLYIYNLQGNQIKSIPLQDRGEATKIIYGSELQPGMYIYTLIADGEEIDTKRMILTD